MNAGVGIGLFICIVIIVIVGAGFKCKTDCDVEYLKTKVTYLDIFYHNLDKRWENVYDVIKLQQEEIKILKEIIEQPEENKKCCCGNCRFYHELNNQDSACLNVDVNNCHKTETTLYADNIPFSWTIKGVKPNDCCEYYEPKEGSNE